MTKIRTPDGIYIPKGDVFEVELIHCDNGGHQKWSDIGKPLFDAGALQDFSGNADRDGEIYAKSGDIAAQISMLMAFYSTNVVFGVDIPTFRRDIKSLKSITSKFLKIYGHGNNAVGKSISMEINVEEDNKLSDVTKQTFKNYDGYLVTYVIRDGIAAIERALDEIIAQEARRGRDRNRPFHELVTRLADHYARWTGREPGRSGSSERERWTPFERFVQAVCDRYDSTVVAANLSAPANAKLPLTPNDKLGTIQRVLAERNARR